jgi:hypothetical protein
MQNTGQPLIENAVPLRADNDTGLVEKPVVLEAASRPKPHTEDLKVVGPL